MGKEQSKLKPEDLREFCNITKFNEMEIKAYYKEFKKRSANGKMDVEQFKNLYADFFPDGDASSFAEHTFNAFDKNGDGSLDFQELIVSMSIMKLGKVNERLTWAFNMYDMDGNGFITREELQGIVVAITKLAGIDHSKNKESVAKEMTDKIFQKVDKNSDGKLSLEEFIEGAKVDKNLSEMLEVI